MDESDCLSVASSHDQETERFLSTGTTGRRVSFNEAALFDHGKKAQEKGRRSESRHAHTSLRLRIGVPFIHCSTRINVHKLCCFLTSKDVHILLCPSPFHVSVGFELIHNALCMLSTQRALTLSSLRPCPTILLKPDTQSSSKGIIPWG